MTKREAVFVAGGTRGINLEIARAFVERGASVAVLGRDKDRVAAAVTELEALGGAVLGYSGDVRRYDDLERALGATAAAFGTLDAVVSGAAGNFLCPANRMSANGFRTVVEIDLIGTFNVFRAAYDVATKPGAAFIAISAPQSTVAHWGQVHACAAKAGVDMLTRALAVEWGPEGIRVNAIVPGPIEGTEGMARMAPTEAESQAIADTVPLRRFGTKREVANLAMFLASPLAAYLTGAVIPCDGGHVLVGPRSGPADPDRAAAHQR